MTLFIAMLPFYLMGNFHCFGMCGPFAVVLGQHQHRYYYFLGRLFSFTVAGTIAGALGAVLNTVFHRFHVGAILSLLLGFFLIIAGFLILLRRSFPGQHFLAKRLAKVNGSLSLLMLKDQPLTIFLFGFLTILLPCGQSLIVFSACALSANAWIGMLNGFAFALLTSPALLMAMRAHAFLGKMKQYYNVILGTMTLFVGGLAACRGLAELNFLPHVSYQVSELLHLSLF